MLLDQKWIIYAITAAMLWGASYATSSPVLREGMSPLVFYFCSSVVGMFTALGMLLINGKWKMIVPQMQALGPNAGWFLFSLLSVAIGGLMTYMAIGEKNATLASLIEISYPLFVVLFTGLFFQEFQLNAMTLGGAALVVGGVSMILLNSH